MLSDGQRGRHYQVSAKFGMRGGSFGRQGLGGSKDITGQVDDSVSARRQLRSARVSDEQGETKLSLKYGDRATRIGLGHPDGSSPCTNPALIRDCHKQFERSQIGPCLSHIRIIWADGELTSTGCRQHAIG